MVTEKDTAHQLVARHILPSTLYTSGMRFYQVKTTLAEDKTLTVQKNGGKYHTKIHFHIGNNLTYLMNFPQEK